jgi:hypothetical protein
LHQSCTKIAKYTEITTYSLKEQAQTGIEENPREVLRETDKRYRGKLMDGYEGT